MSPPIHRCRVELPAPWKIVRLFRLDGIESIGFWTGDSFRASGSSVSVWGWQELEPIDSAEAVRYVALATGNLPSAQDQGEERIRDTAGERPRPFHMISLHLRSGEDVLGLWDGTAYFHHGHEVEPVWWKAVYHHAA